MDKEAREKIALKYCEWCPKDCQSLTKEERVGCLAAGGFADDLPKLLDELGYRKLPKDKPELRQKIIEILVKPLKVPYQEDAAEMMVQGAINQAEEILSLIPDIPAQSDRTRSPGRR